MGWSCFKGNWSVATRSRLFFYPLWRLHNSKIKGVSFCSSERLAMNASRARRSEEIGQRRKWEGSLVGFGGVAGEEEQWSEKWERCWGSLARRLGRRRQRDDGWRGKWWMKKREGEGRAKGRREDKGEQSRCSWHLGRKHLGKLSIRRRSLDWFSPPFQSAFLFAFLFSLRMCPDSNIMLSSSRPSQAPLLFTSGPNSGCYISSPETMRCGRREI